MAEKKKKSASGASSGTGSAKSSSGSRSTPSKKTASSKPSKSRSAGTAAKKKDNVREDPSSLKNTIIPYITGILALLILACYLFRPQMGIVGSGVNSVFFGLFSFGAWFIPLMLLAVTAFWRRDAANGSNGMRIFFAFVSVTLISVLTYAATHVGDKYDIAAFYNDGINSVGGGAVGGTLGWLMLKAVGSTGTVIITVALLFLFLLLTVGFTPYTLFIAIRNQILAGHNRRQLEIEEKNEARAELEEENRRVAEQRRAHQQAEQAKKEEERRKEEERIAREAEKKAADKAAEEEVHRRNREKLAERLAGEADNPEADEAGSSSSRSAGKRRKGKNGGEFISGSFIQPDPQNDRYVRDGVDRGVVASLQRPKLGDEDDDDEGGGYIMGASDGEYDDKSDEIISAAGADTVDGFDFDYDEQKEKVDREAADVIDRDAFMAAVAGQNSDGGESDRGRMSPEEMAVLNRIADGIDDMKNARSSSARTKNEPEDTADNGNPLSDELIRKVTDSAAEKAAESAAAEGDEMIMPPEENEGGQAASAAAPVKRERPPYSFPPITLLDAAPPPSNEDISEELQSTAKNIVDTLASFKVRTKIVNVSRGPTITRYELVPQEGVRVRQVTNSLDDISLNLGSTGVRMEAPIPGKQAIGIEVPNRVVSTVWLRELIDTNKFREAKSKINLCLGADVAGDPVYIDIFKMPHLLVTGATGMGKSVCINSLLVSLLYKASPEEVKLILIDPKKVELNIYNGLPHLLVPVVSDAKKAAGSLAWAVGEMERRFTLIEEVGMRDLAGYNKITEDDPEREKLPQILIIIDELADLMMMARDSVEESICRIAQKARAAGMHLIIGTQRPSVDVITGLIKANVPSRIAFRMASQVDSRTVLDVTGAEKLIGRGDMLFAPVGSTKPMRVQGAYVGEAEIDRVIEYIKSHYGVSEYDDEVIESIEREAAKCTAGKQKGEVAEDGDDPMPGDMDPMFKAALEVAVLAGKVSTSSLQTELRIGYGRAARIIRDMQAMGYISPPDGQKPRTVLISHEQYTEMLLSKDM